jgi:CheY-like chemotaxis protein/HPt (histidine-containing phosphotransfer) domain-containing protein
VAEDNLMNQKYLTNLLKKWNVTYVIANNGREAITAAQKEHFDLIFMDIQMPIVDGYEATIAIRNTHNLNQKTPIVALTASALSDQRKQAIDIGMNDYISKPFGPTQIQEAFKRFLKPIENKLENTDNQLFTFNKELNTDYLNEFYDNDIAYAKEMFELFLSQYVKEFEEVETLLSQGEWTTVKQKLHKIKPSFAMVGLPDFTAKIQAIEDEIAAAQTAEASSKYQFFKNEIQHYLPILESDLLKMKV